MLPQNVGEAGLCQLGRASVPTRRTIPALPSLWARRMGPEENRAACPIDVRSSARRLTHPKRKTRRHDSLAGSACAPGFLKGSLNVKSSTKRQLQLQSVSDLPLFNWRVVVMRPSTRAGTFVARRYRVHPAVADLIASLAGIGSGVQQ
jgi:hypothetical protein